MAIAGRCVEFPTMPPSDDISFQKGGDPGRVDRHCVRVAGAPTVAADERRERRRAFSQDSSPEILRTIHTTADTSAFDRIMVQAYRMRARISPVEAHDLAGLIRALRLTCADTCAFRQAGRPSARRTGPAHAAAHRARAHRRRRRSAGRRSTSPLRSSTSCSCSSSWASSTPARAHSSTPSSASR